MKHSITLAFILLTLFVRVSYGEKTVSEYTLKAAYIERFTRYIEWNKSSHEFNSFVITIVGDSSVVPLFKDYFKNQKVKKRSVIIETLDSTGFSPIPDIVFFATTDSKLISSTLHSIEELSTSVLTISNSNNSLIEGILFSFYLKKNKLRFIINGETLAQTDLTISSFLLEMSDIVGGKYE